MSKLITKINDIKCEYENCNHYVENYVKHIDSYNIYKFYCNNHTIDIITLYINNEEED